MNNPQNFECKFYVVFIQIRMILDAATILDGLKLRLVTICHYGKITQAW